MKKLMSLIICVTLLVSLLGRTTVASASFSTTDEKENMYSAAIQNLEVYLESYGKSNMSLAGIESVFSQLGGFEQSRSLMYYVQILEKLENDDFGFNTVLLLDMLDNSEAFKSYLNENLKGSAIDSVESLKHYVAGREHEFNNELGDAIEEYRACLTFFDSYERYYSLTLLGSETEYSNAIALINSRDYAGAYYTFKNIQAYSDSTQRMASIVNLLGYTPADKADNPKSVADFNAIATPVSVSLNWVDPSHVTEYKVSYRLQGQSGWNYTVLHDNHITWDNLKPNTTYQFLIIAVIGKIETEPVIIEVTTAPKPTSTPSPIPVITPSPTAPKTSLHIGEYIYFGHYEQGDSSGTERIEWKVLDIEGDRALIVSRYVLDCISFNAKNARVSWQTSDIRRWLNNDFLNTAFNSSEKVTILESFISNSQREGYSKWTGGDTSSSYDKVFLLSYAEAWKYFSNDLERYCGATNYAISRGVEPSTKYQVNGRPTCMWWLRSPGELSNSVAGVRKFGTLDFYQVHHTDVGVRPALWIDLTHYPAE